MATLRCCISAKKLFNNVPKVFTPQTVFRGMSGCDIHRVKVLREQLIRKKAMGPEKLVHRNTFLEWNYRAELFAFANRIGEKFNDDVLERALTQRSYVVVQEKQQNELEIRNIESLEDNQSLADKGDRLMRAYVARYLRSALPRFPEEGIIAVRDHLLSEENLARIVSSIGAEELILCADFPAEKRTLASTMCSLVGAVEESNGPQRASLFVRDFVISTLSGQEINHIWSPDKPFDVLSDVLLRDGKAAPEPRIISQSGVNTIIPCYQIGIYCDKKSIGSGAGESIDIAIEQASLNALWRLWGTAEGRYQFPFNLDMTYVQENSKDNISLLNWSSKEASLRSSQAV